jgi:L-arabinose 1-dehydrogenase [NAD(P)+]
MADVAVTGAAGAVGRETVAALTDADHAVTPITHRPHDDIDGPVLDVRDREAVVAAFDGHDTVVHLAAASDAAAPWDRVRDVNVDGTWGVYDAARETGVGRVVFASSIHVTHMLNMPDPDDPSGTAADATVVDAETLARPSSPYGVTKVAGEAIGSLFADRYGIETVNCRIGYLQDEATLREHQSDAPARARQARSLFLSPRDCRQGIERAVVADLDRNPLTVHLVSRNADRHHVLVDAKRELGYRPRDDATELLGRSPGE